MLSIMTSERLSIAVQIAFIITALQPQATAVLPRYIPVVEETLVERDAVIDGYFHLGLHHREILGFLLLSHGIILSLRQVERILAFRELPGKVTPAMWIPF